jgi:hypothetical protein
MTRSVVAVLVPFVWVGGVAVAQAPAPERPGHAAAGLSQAPAGASAPAKTVKRERNRRAHRVAVADKREERPKGASTVDEALTSCLALWEPATHMTKQEWARACRRVAERLRGTG